MKIKFLQPNKVDARPLNYSTQESSETVYVDNELARRSIQGDLSAFEELFNRHQKRVYNITLQMLHDESEAADATQEVFVRAYRSIGKLISEEAFVTWLKTMTINICRDILRKRGKVRLESLDAPVQRDDGSSTRREIADSSNDPSDSAITKNLQESVQDAIRSLQPDYREVVTLFYVDGADIAESLRHRYPQTRAAWFYPSAYHPSRTSRESASSTGQSMESTKA